MRKLFLLVACVVLGCAHSSTQVQSKSGPEKISGKFLTLEDAKKRAENISQVAYKMNFDLSDTETAFSGLVQISFSMADINQPLRLDFEEGAVKSLKVNGAEAKTDIYNGFYFGFAPGTFVKGMNTITIDYTHPYDKNGVGLHRFKDPEDGQVYVYTNFEPFDAHRLFPCFDQPDLKAHYTLDVIAQKGWSVITSVRETSSRPIDKNEKLMKWTFPESAKISTYLISLHAGPYMSWKSSAGNISLRLFARKSLGKYIVPQDWFFPTQAGLKFYGNYFNVKYPFEKYDQVIAPEFNEGAMENVAAVTFTESFVKRGAATVEDREHLGSVILHEMAHMWFGDLVTMKWWNGLWLNESFATFMSALALHEATPYKRSFESLYLDDKLWAYYEDGMHTTHPIEANVPDTDQAFANFDGITYGKGASALKQLSFFIGPDKFRDGVRRYFKKYAYQNATLKDFLDSLQQESPENLTEWSKEWLETSGYDILANHFSCSGASLKKVVFTQGATDESYVNGKPILRHHRTNIGFYNLSSQVLKLRGKKTVKYFGAETAYDAQGRCPDLIYPNIEDQDYVRVEFQPSDVAVLKDHLSSVADTYDRLLFYQGLWDLVRDQKLSSGDYLEIVAKNVENETDLKVLELISREVFGRKGGISALAFLFKDPKFNQIQSKIENIYWDKLKRAPAKSDLQKKLFDYYLSAVLTPKGQENLKGLLKDPSTLPGFTLDQDRKWDIIHRLSALGTPGVSQLLTQEKSTDTSNMGVLMAIASEVSEPNLKVKKTWLKRILTDKNMPLAQKRAAMTSLFPWFQEDLRAQAQDDIYQSFDDVVKNQGEDFQQTFVGALVPVTCNLESSLRLEKYLAAHSTLPQAEFPPVISKNLKNALQETQRCVKVRALGAS